MYIIIIVIYYCVFLNTQGKFLLKLILFINLTEWFQSYLFSHLLNFLEMQLLNMGILLHKKRNSEISFKANKKKHLLYIILTWNWVKEQIDFGFLDSRHNNKKVVGFFDLSLSVNVVSIKYTCAKTTCFAVEWVFW